MFKFVFTLFNLQGTDKIVSVTIASVANFYMLPQLISFVKNFFKFFQTFLWLSLLAFARNLIILSQRFSFVKHFFLELRSFVYDPLYQRHPCGQLAYISTHFPNCQALFYKFRHYFLCTFTIYTCASLVNISITPSPRHHPDQPYVIRTVYYYYIWYSLCNSVMELLGHQPYIVLILYIPH